MALAVAVSAGIVAVLSGCATGAAAVGDGATGDGTPGDSRVATLTPAPAKATSAAGALAGAQSMELATGAPAAQCAPGALLLSVTALGASPDGTKYRLRFRNIGSTTCELRGAPQLAVAGASGNRQLGPAAAVSAEVPDAAAATTVAVAPGASVMADFMAADLDAARLPKGCVLVQGDGWLVVPPYSSIQVFVPQRKVPACADGPVTLTVLSAVTKS